MSIRLTQPTRDVAKLNEALSQVDILTRRLVAAESVARSTKIAATRATQQLANPPVTNLAFTWTGSSCLVSWPAGYIKNSRGIVTAVAAGSKFLSPSSYYWVYYNPIHKQVIFANSPSPTLTGNSKNLVVCSLKTGTGTQSGAAGGGGTEPQGYGNMGYKYTNF
jgi:hypothetical protein